MNNRSRPRSRPHLRAPQRESLPATTLVKQLIVAHVAVWVGLATVFTAPAVSEALRFDPATFLSRPWSIITYPLVHDGFVHVALLMMLLALTGPVVASHLGSRRFLLYYLYCTIGGAAASLVFSGLLAIPSTGGALAPILGVILARTWIAAADTSGSTSAQGQLPVLALLGLLGTGVLIAGLIIPTPGLALPHVGGLLAGYLFWRMWSVGRDRPPVTPLPIRHVVLTRAHAEHDHAPDAPVPPALSAERHEPSLDTSRETIDRLLDKISAEGIESLTNDERTSLTDYSRRKGRDDIDS